MVSPTLLFLLSLCKLNFLPLPLPLGQAKPFSRPLSDLILLASSSSPPQNAGGGRGQKRNGEGLSPTSIFSLIFPPFLFCPFFSEELGGKFAEKACLYRILFSMTAFFAGECDPRIFHSAFSLLFPPFSAPPSVSLFSDVRLKVNGRRGKGRREKVSLSSPILPNQRRALLRRGKQREIIPSTVCRGGLAEEREENRKQGLFLPFPGGSFFLSSRN